MWPERRTRALQELFGIDLPIIQAPMAGSVLSDMVIAVSNAGGLGSLPCALLGLEQMRTEIGRVREHTSRPMNLNFFCHSQPASDPARDARWKERLAGYYAELGVDPSKPTPSSSRAAFDDAACALVEETRPEVVSFHFGLPARDLLARVRKAGAKVLSSATTVEEARWLEDEGCDAIIAQGYEAGGHRGMFLTKDIGTQLGTMSLVPQVVDAVKVPVIASGGIADARGIVAALALGASGVQLGTAYLFCPEARIGAHYRAALAAARGDDTRLTNVHSGRPARGFANRIVREVGPMSDLAPEFPLAGGAIAPLRAKAESDGSGEFSPLWSGQSAHLGRSLPAAELTRTLIAEARALASGEPA